VRQARKDAKSLEVTRRLDRLLQALETPAPAHEELRKLRAIEILEIIDTPAARELLAQQAKGDPGLLVTQDAQRGLRRLSGRAKER